MPLPPDLRPRCVAVGTAALLSADERCSPPRLGTSADAHAEIIEIAVRGRRGDFLQTADLHLPGNALQSLKVRPAADGEEPALGAAEEQQHPLGDGAAVRVLIVGLLLDP